MREVVDREKIERVMRALGDAADRDIRVYFAGGATAVLIGWRAATVDIDLVAVPEADALMRAIPALKESLAVNIEIASPAHFVPVPAGWEERGTFIARHGRVEFFHFDLVAQALAKLERRHARDREDIREMVSRGLVDARRARAYFEKMEPELYRFPAIHPATYRRAVDEVFPASA
jgi:hypothetical protein